MYARVSRAAELSTAHLLEKSSASSRHWPDVSPNLLIDICLNQWNFNRSFCSLAFVFLPGYATRRVHSSPEVSTVACFGGAA